MSHVVIPSSAPLHSVQGDGFRKTYYSSIQVNRSQEYRWKVYLGDVVAFSTEPALSLAGIEKWEPKHYQKASPHWKIGLVVGLAQVASPKSINFECSVQLLEKLLDNSSATKKLRKTLRPWRKSSATNDTCQTPHLLLKSNKFETIDPLKLLPVTITMMEREEFKQGVQIGSEESLSLKFHCSKSISEDGSDIINEEPKADEWALLNSSSSSFSMDALHIPKPLQEAWPKWSVIQEKPALLNHLINGFRKAIKEKRKAFKEKQNVYNHEKRRAVLENQPDNKEVDVNDASAVKTNKRKEAGSGKDGSNSKKRIRIQLPNEVPEDKTPFKPQPSTSTNKKALPSIMKNKSTNSSKSTRKQNSESNNKKQPASFTARRQARSVNNKAKATTAKTTPKTKAKATPKAKAKPSMKVQAPKKGKTLSKQECGTPSTADTNSTDEAMPSRGRRKTILSNAKPTFQLQISPLSESVLTQKHDGQQSDFYESVEIAIDKNVFKKRIVPKSKTFRIAVGNMLAVRSDDSIARTWTPFGIKWGVAQLVAIYKVKSNKEWMMDVRWFYRHREIKESNRSRLGDFSKSRGLLEKTEVYTCPLESALPAYVILTSEGGKTRVGQLPTVCKEDGLPIIYFLCQHLQKGKRVVNVKDWNNYHKSIASIPDSLTRGLVNEAVNSSLADIYKALISQRVCVDPEEGTDDEPSSASDEEMEEPNPLAVVPLTPQPILERWGKKFYDGIRLDIDQNSLSSDFCPTTKQWTLKVGYIIPIYCEHESLSNYGGKSKCWYPFVASWSAGQVVSIYRTESGEWMMQIRWFHRFFELNDGQKSGLKSLDKAHIVFETEEYTHLPVTSAFPGRVVLTSCDTDDWEIATSLVAGLPLIPRLCAYMCLDDDIDISMDWTNYDIDLNSKSVPVPLVRGLLLAPTHRENKEWILTLSRYYRKYITLRGSDPNEEVFRKWQSKGEKPLSIKYEGPIRFEPRDVNMLCSHLLETASSPSREFFRNLKNTAPVKYIASPLKKMKRMKKHSFSCNVGDIVCFYDANAKNKTDHILMKNMKHPWYPFQVSWSFGQVLSIYRDSTGGSDNIPCVEIRRLYRASELPMAVQVFLPSIEDNEREEVFETDDIIEKLPASSLLGTADIYLGQYKTGANEEDISRPISIASCRCRFFYLTAYQRLQPLFSSGFSHQIWFRRFQGRGLQLSRMVKKFKSLGESMAIPLPTGKNPLDIRILLGENRNAGKSTTTGVCKARALPQENASQRRLFADALIPPQWSTFDCCDLFYDQEDQRLDWKVEIGDFVATRNATPKEGSWYPFREPWIPCQVLAIYSDGDKEKHDSVSLESLQFELGILQMKSSGSAEMGLAEIGECNPPRTKIMGAVDLLGPLSLYHRGVQCNVDSDKAHLPWAVCRASETLSSELTTKSLGISSVYSKTDITNVLQKLGGNQKLKPSRSEDKTHSMHNVVRKSGDAWTSVAPSYVDLSRYRAYYTELNLIPPHKCSSDKNNRSDRTPWVVRMGDIVMINCDGAKRSPMECNWGVAEVVAVWKDFQSYEELENDGESNQTQDASLRKISIEIRWFYERDEIVGVSYSDSAGASDEIFETDHVDVINAATSLIAPVMLYVDSRPKDDEDDDDDNCIDVSMQKFVCRRFWSTTRKSLIPCGSLEGRQRRGWVYSKYLPEEMKRFSMEVKSCSASSSLFEKSANLTWKESMARIISKLTLRDASRGAYERGETLIGREKELHQLMLFFRAAIRGEAGPGGVRSSMFIGGPPGVGKTACVRAALARLRMEQTAGDVPKFKFIPLNGMEMRHPFEAYVKFWEALTGRKHVGSHEKACEYLETHFTSPKSLHGYQDKTVSVVLLDEIDYLMTEKQTVLYNFFDWPKRAEEVPNGRRLIVIGISNTLNLAEQLQTKVQSRVGSEKCLFKAYNLNDTVAILKSKIEEASPNRTIFENDAILFAAKKTAALSGDIRKAFQICRAAAELVLQNYEADKENQPIPTVRISDVQKASRESFNMAVVTAVSYSTSFQALLLVSLAALLRSTGREVGGFDIKDIMMKMEAIAGASGDHQYSPPPSFGETIRLLNRLGENNIVNLQTATSTLTTFRSSTGGNGGAWPLASLAVDESVLLRGLRNTPHRSLAEKNLPCLF